MKTAKQKSEDRPVDKQSKQPNLTGKKEAADFVQLLLSYESEVRDISHEQELIAHLANSPRRLFSFRQIIIFRRTSRKARYHTIAASSLAIIDRNSPQVRWFEKIINRIDRELSCDEIQTFSLPAFCDEADEETRQYPFSEFCWVPLVYGEQTFGGVLLTQDQPWTEIERLLIKRTVSLYAHAWCAIKGQERLLRRSIFSRTTLIIAVPLLCVLALLPVSITALAPVEVIPSHPFVVAAPFDGVVKQILVEKNKIIKQGDAIIAFEDVSLRNEFEIADQNQAVAKARFLRVSQSAISDKSAKRELTIAKAELALAEAEKNYAFELLAKAVVEASKEGLAIYTDKRDWVGRPVSAGEAILLIANPDEIQFEISLPVKDSLVLKEGARVKIFLDSDPLHPLEASLVETSYMAQNDKRDILTYRITAQLNERGKQIPRIGIQGTAQIFSEKAPLIYVLLRRPLATMRQLTGW